MAGCFPRRFCVVCLLSLGGLACRRTPEPPGAGGGPVARASETARPLAAAPALASATPAVEITWVDPAGLRRVPPKSPMRKASYEVPRAAGDTEDGELAVFYFGPGQGGGIDANVDRWVKQFAGVPAGDVKRADRQANGLREHTVEIVRGTFDPGQMAMGGATGPKKDYALLGAIVEAPSGAYFFKMTGPAHTVAAAKTAFYSLLDSIRASS